MRRVLTLADYLRAVDTPDYAAHVLFCLASDIITRWKEPRCLDPVQCSVLLQTTKSMSLSVRLFFSRPGLPTMQSFQAFMRWALDMLPLPSSYGLHHFSLLAHDPQLSMHECQWILQGKKIDR